MNLKEQFNGIQHIGIPTNDIEATIDFYKANCTTFPTP